MGQKLNANGTLNGLNFPVDNSLINGQNAPAIATDGGVNYSISYNSKDSSGIGVFKRTYNSSTGIVSSASLVNTNIESADQKSSRVAMNASGESVVTWVDASFTTTVFAQRYDANGIAVGTPFSVYSASLFETVDLPAVSLMDDGTATFVWQLTPFLGSPD